MPRTEPRACPAGLHQLGPNIKTRRGCPACPREVDLARIMSWVAALDGALERAVVIGAVDAAAPSEVHRRALVRHLEADPGVLAAGRSAAPNVVCRFIAELVAAGATGVAPPRCARCGQAKRRLHPLRPCAHAPVRELRAGGAGRLASPGHAVVPSLLPAPLPNVRALRPGRADRAAGGGRRPGLVRQLRQAPGGDMHPLREGASLPFRLRGSPGVLGLQPPAPVLLCPLRT